VTWPADQPLSLPPAGTPLADVAPEQYAAVEEDRERWRQAHVWIRARARSEIREELAKMPTAKRSDMARRLNAIEAGRRKQEAGRESQPRRSGHG
jgi:hypothetical protein